MLQKPSPKTRPTRKRAACNPANFGIIPSMRAREIIEQYQYENGERSIWLKPVPIATFFAEVQAMRHAKYVTYDVEGRSVCPSCDCQTAVCLTYWQHHRNGKRKHETQRAFEFCFDCQHVTEVLLIGPEHNQLVDENQDVTEIQPE